MVPEISLIYPFTNIRTRVVYCEVLGLQSGEKMNIITYLLTTEDKEGISVLFSSVTIFTDKDTFL